jgi:hypothetical protein
LESGSNMFKQKKMKKQFWFLPSFLLGEISKKMGFLEAFQRHSSKVLWFIDGSNFIISWCHSQLKKVSAGTEDLFPAFCFKKQNSLQSVLVWFCYLKSGPPGSTNFCFFAIKNWSTRYAIFQS